MNHSEQIKLQNFDNLEQQSQYLADVVAQILQTQVNNNGLASIAVSGGSTPKRLFELLSKFDLEWSKVAITLVDDQMARK